MPLYCMSAFEQIQHIKKAIITSIPFFCIVGIYLPHKYSAFPEYSHYLSCKKENKSTYDSNYRNPHPHITLSFHSLLKLPFELSLLLSGFIKVFGSLCILGSQLREAFIQFSRLCPASSLRTQRIPFVPFHVPYSALSSGFVIYP